MAEQNCLYVASRGLGGDICIVFGHWKSSLKLKCGGLWTKVFGSEVHYIGHKHVRKLDKVFLYVCVWNQDDSSLVFERATQKHLILFLEMCNFSCYSSILIDLKDQIWFSGVECHHLLLWGDWKMSCEAKNDFPSDERLQSMKISSWTFINRSSLYKLFPCWLNYTFLFSWSLQPANQSSSVKSSAWLSWTLIWSRKPAQHACPALLHLYNTFVSVNKIHFHRFVCPVLYTCSKNELKKFADLCLIRIPLC